ISESDSARRRDTCRKVSAACGNCCMTFDLILVGFGNVARRFVRLLDELRPDLKEEHDIDTRVVGIATRSHGQAYDACGLATDELATAGGNGEPIGPAPGSTLAFMRRALKRSAAAARRRHLVVVEATTLDIERGQPAIAHVRTALAGGAHVVSTNKGPAAFAYHALNGAAVNANRCFLFESAVMDGVPGFNLRRATMAALTLTRVPGVLNSTT